MTNSGLTALEGKWNRQEYPAGFRARLTDIPSPKMHTIAGVSDGKTPTRRCWNCPVINGRSLRAGKTQIPGTSFLMGAGTPRVNGISFDEDRTEPWKEGWIAADINMGVHGLKIA
jgi:hypothetical protein